MLPVPLAPTLPALPQTSLQLANFVRRQSSRLEGPADHDASTRGKDGNGDKDRGGERPAQDSESGDAGASRAPDTAAGSEGGERRQNPSATERVIEIFERAVVMAPFCLEIWEAFVAHVLQGGEGDDGSPTSVKRE